MSIYSGFATRQQEEAYDENINSLLYILQKRIIKFFKGEKVNDLKFIDLIAKMYANLRTMQQSKYLQPKLSNSLTQLAQYLNTIRPNLSSIDCNQKNIYSKQDNIQPIIGKQSIICKPQFEKFVITQRIAKYPQQNFNGLLKQTLHNHSSIRQRRAASNTHHKSSKYVNFYQQQNKNAKNLSFQNNNNANSANINYSHSKNSRNQKKRGQNYEQQNGESNKQQDVRDLIKGYLAKKKRNQIQQTHRNRKEVQQIFL